MGICESVLCGSQPSEFSRVRDIPGLTTEAAVNRVSKLTENVTNGGAKVNLKNTNNVLSSTTVNTGFAFFSI